MNDANLGPQAGDKISVQINPVCGNCFHWDKTGHPELNRGICTALPPGCSYKGHVLVKVRPSTAADERGCTGLFTPRQDLLDLALAAQRGGANESADAPGGAVIV
jgi:hypothetical protein